MIYFYLMIGFLACVPIFLWFYSQSVRHETMADMTAKMQKGVSDAKTKEAAIYSLPSGSKRDIISRL